MTHRRGTIVSPSDEQAPMVGIFGAGRNGSTLLMRLLDGSSGLWVYPIELNYLSTIAPRSLRGRAAGMASQVLSGRAVGRRLQERYARSIRRWVAEQLDELRTTYLEALAEPLRPNGDPVGTVSRAVGRSIQHDLPAFLRAVRSVYDDRRVGTHPYLMFKSVRVADLPRYQALYPDMRFVHIVRHPLSNYASLKRTDMLNKRKPFWFQGGDILRTQLEDRWIPHVRFILENNRNHPNEHFVVKYEDLCETPETLVRGICEWLGVEPPAEPGVQTVLGGRRMRELPVNPSQRGVKTPDRVVRDMAGQFGYEEVLTGREKDFILTRTYDLARQLGYLAEEVRLPSALTLGLRWLPPDRWDVMNSSSKLRLARAFICRRYYVWSKLLFPSR